MFAESSCFWWQAPADECHSHVVRYVKDLEEDQHDLALLNLRLAKLYDGRGDLLDWTPSRPTRSLSVVSENMIKQAVDTAVAMIGKSRPKASFMTDDAEWSTQRTAQQLDRFCEGLFQQAKVYDKGSMIFRDAAVFGTGVGKVVEEDGKPCLERVFPGEIIVDELECRFAEPRQIHQRHFIDRYVLAAMYPEHDEAIMAAYRKGDDVLWTSWRKIEPQQVVVVESWRKPSKKGSGDGVHCLTIDGATLFHEEWAEDDFPFVFFHWSRPLAGFWGSGLVEESAGAQLKVNKYNKFMDACIERVAVPRVYVHASDAQMRPKLTNEVGQLVPYKNKPPIFETPRAVSPEVLERIRDLKQGILQNNGISPLAAQSLKPAGLESAVALREFQDIEQGRFAIQAITYEGMYLEVARRFIDLAKKIAERGGPITVAWRSRNLVKQIDWKDVDLEETAYIMSIEASSLLSRTPAARTQTVIEWAQAGIIGQDEARRLLDHPDLRRESSLFNAAIDDADATIEAIYDGEFEPPEPLQNLPLCIKRMQMEYLRVKRRKAPPEILDDMRRWLTMAQQLIAAAQAPVAENPASALAGPAPLPPPDAVPPGVDAGAGAMPPMPPELGVAMPGQPVPALSVQAQQLQPD